MRIIILGFLLFPCLLIAQKTFIPDDAFEQVLINLDLDDVIDDSVYTLAIDTVQSLFISSEGIADLSGIEEFTALTNLFCYDNELISLDLSNNPNLFEVNCRDNQLTSLSVKNGNPGGLWYFMANDNPNLPCVEVDNVAHAYYNWQIDNTAVFSTNCMPSDVSDLNRDRKLIKVLDFLGRDVMQSNSNYLLYIYDDGTVEKKVIIK